MGSDADSAPQTRVDALKAVLESGTQLLAAITSDGILHRLIVAYDAMPQADRDAIVEVIEREVQARLLSQATEGVTGQGMHPNRNARLYLRSHGQEVQRSDLETNEMMQAALRAMRVTPLLLVPEIHAEWQKALRGAVGGIDGPTLAIVERLLREALDLVTARRTPS